MGKKKPSSSANDTYSKQQTKLLKSIRDIVKRGKERGYIFFDEAIPDNLQIPASASELVIPDPVKNPSEITVARLQRIKDTLYENAIWQDPHYHPDNPEYAPGTPNYEDESHATGLFSGLEGRAIERSRQSKKGWQTRQRGYAIDDDDFEPPFNPQPPSHEPVWYAIFDTVRGYLERLEEIRGSGNNLVQEARERAGNHLLYFFDSIVLESQTDETEDVLAKRLQSNAEMISRYIDDMEADSRGERLGANVSAIMELIQGEPVTVEQASNYEDYMNGGYDYDR